MECSDDLEKAVKDQDFQQAAFLKDHLAELERQRDQYASVFNNQEEMTERVEKVHDWYILYFIFLIKNYGFLKHTLMKFILRMIQKRSYAV